MLGLRPLAQPALVLRREVRLAAQSTPCSARIISCASEKWICGIAAGTSGSRAPSSASSAA